MQKPHARRNRLAPVGMTTLDGGQDVCRRDVPPCVSSRAEERRFLPGRSRGIEARRDVLASRFGRSALAVRGAREIRAEITKCGIEGPDQLQFLFAAPVFELFFPADGGAHIGEGFKIDESSDVVGCGESGAELGFVLGYAAFEKIGYAGVEDTGSAGQNIDIVNSHRWLVWQGGG
jgi:hypothetical protein